MIYNDLVNTGNIPVKANGILDSVCLVKTYLKITFTLTYLGLSKWLTIISSFKLIRQIVSTIGNFYPLIGRNVAYINIARLLQGRDILKNLLLVDFLMPSADRSVGADNYSIPSSLF